MSKTVTGMCCSKTPVVAFELVIDEDERTARIYWTDTIGWGEDDYATEQYVDAICNQIRDGINHSLRN
jgi:hypothetical protein